MIRLVRMNGKLEQELIETALLRDPYEVCGIVYGFLTDSEVTAESFVVVRNGSATPDRSFSFHPDEWIRLFFEAQKNQRTIVGFFHSHPRGFAVPSLQDVHETLPWVTYWIVGSAPDAGKMISVYRIESGGRWVRLPVERVP